MSSPSEDLGALHAAREAELERQQLIDWARQRTAAMISPSGPSQTQTQAPTPTPELQDPATPTPQQQDVGPGDVARDVGRGIVAAPREAAGGFLDAIKNTSKFITDVQGLGDAVEPMAQDLPDVEGSGTVTGGLVRGISQFATGLFGAGKITALGRLAGLGTAGAIAAPLAKGAVANFAVFDPDQERLSNLIEEFPVLSNPVTSYLQSDPADSEAEGRFKLALEGLGLGVSADMLGKGVRALRSFSQAKVAAGVADDVATAALRQAEGQQAELTTRIGDPAAPRLSIVQAPEAAADQPGQVFVNWSRINAHDDVKAMVQELADARGGNVAQAARGTRGWNATRAAAGELDAWEVLQARQAGQPLNAEQTYAVRELWINSGRKVRELAQAVANNGGELDQLAFRKQLLVHNAIQEQVIPARTETARALNAWAIPAGDSPAFAGQMDQLKALAQSDRADLGKIARGIASLDDAGLVRELDAFVESSALVKTGDALRQAWYGSLLSNPKSIVRNITGTTARLLIDIPETRVASFLGRTFGDEAVPSGEATERLFGLVQGYKDAWSVSAKSRRVFDAALTKMAAEGDEAGARALFAEEADQFYSSLAPEAQGGVRPFEAGGRGALSPETWNVGRESIPGRVFAWMETATTAGPKALQRSDEIFKSMAYNAELRAQAYRQARQELASGSIEKPAFEDRLAEILASPTDTMRLAARSSAEVQTFTNQPLDTPLWGFVKSWHNVPVLGDITMPFARTPYNIATQTLQRTPLSPFMRSWREDIMAGGARGHQAWSRFIVGNTILLTAADLALNGHLTGEGPSDPAERAAMARQGWKPWSARVGNAYFDYRAIDPIGPLIGLAANTIDILKAKDFGRADANGRFEQLVVATSMSLAAQVTNQSFMTGASSFFDAMQDPQRYGEKWWQQLATSALIPRGVAAVERVTDPTQRLAWDIGTAIRSQTPGLSKELPPARNLWGDPITSGSGYGPWYDLLSPFTASQVKASPVDAELQRLEHWIGAAPRKLSFAGASVDLATNPKAYSRFVELAGNGAKIDGLGLREKLEALVAGKDDASDVYRELTDGPDGSKAMMLDRYVQGYRDAAKAQLLEEFPEIRAELDRRREEKQEALTPQ